MNVALSRRTLMAGGAALLGSACRHWPGPPPPVPARPYADMHVHLFNAHDLPVGTFLVDVLFARVALPRPLKAVIDYLVRAGQAHAISAADEYQRLVSLRAAGVDDERWTPEAFGDDFADWATSRAYAEPPVAGLFVDEADRRASYDELVQAVVADARGSTVKAAGARLAANAAARATTVRNALAELARKAESDPVRQGAPGDGIRGVAEPRTATSGTPRCREECPDHRYSLSLPAILRYLGWAYLMVRSREAHLVQYLRQAEARGDRPVGLVNHLVDYDAWLEEPRLPGSSHLQQVAVADALAARYAVARDGLPAVTLTTFAGFCPLKHALEMRGSGRAPTLEALLALADRRQVGGFKLYPPMGFQPSGNAALANRAFDPQSTVRRATWRRTFGGGPDGHEIGEALDRSLDAFYAECARRRLPLMAHAGPGNAAGPGFGERANPRHWLPVAQRHALRISLGHLVDDAGDFVCAVKAGTQPPCVWALDAMPQLLNPAAGLRATVYADLAFMPELIGDRALAADFFRAVAAVFGPADPKLTRIMYGSDHIMLATMKDYDQHLSAMRQGMADAGYDAETVDNILQNNARRFLQA